MKNFEPRMNANERKYSFSSVIPVKAGISAELLGDSGFRRNDVRIYSRSFAFICGFCFLLLAAIPARADVSPQATLMVANVAGECDVLYSMIDFQKKNNINGGSELVGKFWASEAAKMNLTVEQLSDRCSKTTAAYDKLWGSAAPSQGGAANGNE